MHLNFLDREEQQLLRKSLGFNNNDFILICLDENIPFMIQLMSHLESNIKLLVPKTEAAEKQIKKLKLENRIYFWNQKEDYIKIADLGIAIGTSQNKQNMIKAMSYGIPLLAIKNSENQNLIKNDITGYFIEDFNEIIHYIHFLMQNQKFNQNLGANGFHLMKHYLEQNNIEICQI